MAVHLVPPSEDTRSGYGFSISILASLPLENPTSSANDRQACNWLGQSGVVQVRPPSCEISMDSHSPSMQRPLSCGPSAIHGPSRGHASRPLVHVRPPSAVCCTMYRRPPNFSPWDRKKRARTAEPSTRSPPNPPISVPVGGGT